MGMPLSNELKSHHETLAALNNVLREHCESEGLRGVARMERWKSTMTTNGNSANAAKAQETECIKVWPHNGTLIP